MDAFCRLNGLVAPLDRSNVDTDAIIPKQFLKSINRTGFGPNLFDEWRYLDHGELDMDCSKRPLNADFVLNQPRYQGAEILLTRDNFGCGSSREHAPWALFDYGFRAVVAPSFAEIFANNCCKNSILPVVLPAETVAGLFDEVEATPGYRLIVDLEKQQVITPSGEAFEFAVDPFRKECLLKGLDDISLTLQHVEAIKGFEAKKKGDEPWLFG
ncbi:MAG: 3-isopropylmalate dehydratase small subunit [Deltaproteobacteria bacterium]|nr:MAG: 3-isopropylmalate dehydratase small subunit [Deltaproteobacteria bacterium]